MSQRSKEEYPEYMWYVDLARELLGQGMLDFAEWALNRAKDEEKKHHVEVAKEFAQNARHLRKQAQKLRIQGNYRAAKRALSYAQWMEEVKVYYETGKRPPWLSLVEQRILLERRGVLPKDDYNPKSN